MYRCAQCGATLKEEKQTCPRCSDQRSAPVLPTLFGFGDEAVEDAQKTIQMTHRPEHTPQKKPKASQTVPLISPIPAVPNLHSLNEASSDYDLLSFASDDSTEVTSLQSPFGKRPFSSISDQKTEVIESEDDIDFTMSEGFEDNFSDIEVDHHEEDEDFGIALPPPVPPPSDSPNSVDLRKIANPFAASKKQPVHSYNATAQSKAVQSQASPQLSQKTLLKSNVLWFGPQGMIRKSIRQQESLILPQTHKKIATVHLNEQDFSFDGALNQEIWQPIKDKMEITHNNTLRSGSLIMKWLEMTVENTEVISQPSMAIWEVKANQERVFYGAFNLFPGISRVGGSLCEISLPFVKTKGPIFTVELDLNGHLWCRSYAQNELWSLVRNENRFVYGQILATQGKLFTVSKDLSH